MIRTPLTLALLLALGSFSRADDAAELTAFAKKHHASVTSFNAGMLALVFTDKATDDDMAAVEKSAPKTFSALELGNAKEVTDAGFLQLKSLAAVHNLSLPPRISNKGVVDLKKRFPGAGRISYVGNAKNGTLDNDGVKSIAELESLREVSLNNGRFDDAIWESLGKCTKLRTLVVQSGTITGQGIEALKGCTELTTLDLFKCPLATGVGKSLAKLSAVKSIALNGSTVADGEMAPLAEMPALLTLYICETKVGDEGLLKLAPSKSLTRVHTGVDTKVTKDGSTALMKLNPKIEVNY